MSNWTQNEIETLINACQKKAAIDADFRQEVLANPLAAAQKMTEKEVPAGLKIKVIESDDNYDYTFVLPELLTGKVDEAALDSVVGGGDCGTFSSGGGTCYNFTPCNNDISRGGKQGKGNK